MPPPSSGERDRCPLCQHAEPELVRALPMAALRRGWARFGITEIGGGPDLAAVAHLRCPRCTLEFFAPRLLGDSAFYQALARHDWYYMQEKWEYEEAMRDVGPGERVLEVGAGAGAFLEKLRRAGVSATGIELNEAAVRQARERGLDLRHVALEEFEAAGQGYDVVCSFQVLEHLASPRQFLQRCLQLLRPGGRLIISTPNQASFLLRDAPLGVLNMPPHHQSRWARRAYEYAAGMLQASIVRLSYEPLARYHAGLAVSAWLNRAAGYPGDLPEDHSEERPLPYRALLALGVRAGGLALRPLALRRRLTGHSIYVVMRKPRDAGAG